MADKEINIPDGLIYLAKLLSSTNHTLYIVGGYVRDALLGTYDTTSGDIDICSDCLPDEFIHITENDNRVSIKTSNYPLGTIKLFVDDVELEYTCFRRESYRGDGYHTPNEVAFTTDIYEDALRRDFTINSIYLDILKNVLYDPFNGTGDLIRQVIKCNRDSWDVFTEDALRILRMCRFTARLGFDIDSDTMAGARECNRLINNISRERIGQELNGVLMSKHVELGLMAMIDCGLMDYIFPHINEMDLSLVKHAPMDMDICWAVFLHKLSPDKTNEFITSLSLGKSFAKSISLYIDNIYIAENDKEDIAVLFARNGVEFANKLISIISVLNIDGSDKLSTIYSDMVDNNKFIDFNSIAFTGNDIMDLLDVEPRQIPSYKEKIYKYIVNNPKENNYQSIKEFILSL